jgi:simple sugar transport system ATP-binding protein
MPDPLMQMVEVSKSFGPVKALENVSLAVNRGEIVGLLGDNGAGKSTLVKIASGVLQADKGDVYFQGRKVIIRSPEDARKLGVETTYQDLAICEDLPIWRNVFLSREVIGAIFMDKKTMRKETWKALENLQIGVSSIEQKLKFLSGGQRQSVALARGLYFNAELLLMDEPTAALGVAESNALLQLMLELKKRGKSIVFITHNLRHIFSVVDRLIILYKGRRVADLAKEGTSIEEVETIIVTGKNFDDSS